MGRSRILLCILLAGIAGCKTERREQTAPVTPVREHVTFRLEGNEAVDTSFAVRDLFTDEQLTLERRGGLLVLRAPQGIIDTMSAPTTLEPGERLGARIDSSFVQLSSAPADTLATRTADLVCVAHGRLHWSARLPLHVRLPGAESRGVYSTTFTLLRSPLAMSGNERFDPTMTESGAPAPWRHPFDLRFDDSAGAFYNVSIALEDVPFADGSAPATGRHFGIALRVGTSVLIGRQWYALSVPDDLDADEFARGTVGMVLEGKGEWGDTLRPLAAPLAAKREP